MADFDEKSPPVVCETQWGRWWQTVDEVQVEIHCEGNVSSKEVRVNITPSKLECTVKGKEVISGSLAKAVKSDDSTWSLEDKKIIRILLAKSNPNAGNLWPSLLLDSKDGNCYEVDPFTLDKMQQKLTLQRFQIENPGMDFSGAEITGNYAGGGPKLPEYSPS